MALRSVSVYRLVQIALEDGDLIRPDRCEECDASASEPGIPYKIFAHHDDYSKPLDVRWLCGQCHQKWHNENEPLNRQAKTVLMEPLEEAEDSACLLCGNPVKCVTGKVPATYHRPCRDLKNFLAAAVRAAKQIDPAPTDECRKKIQHQAFVAQCRISARIAKRDSRGRFC